MGLLRWLRASVGESAPRVQDRLYGGHVHLPSHAGSASSAACCESTSGVLPDEVVCTLLTFLDAVSLARNMAVSQRARTHVCATCEAMLEEYPEHLSASSASDGDGGRDGGGGDACASSSSSSSVPVGGHSGRNGGRDGGDGGGRCGGVAATLCAAREAATLRVAFPATWADELDWRSDAPLGAWRGVRCGGQGVLVRSLRLSNKQVRQGWGALCLGGFWAVSGSRATRI